MPHVFDGVARLERTAKVGDGDYVDLVKQAIPSLKGRHTSSWKKGEQVIKSRNLKPGTAIATFLCDRYPLGPNKHAALFVGYLGVPRADGTYAGFTVMDQWKMKTNISSRPVRSKGMEGANCNPTDNGVSNNADTYYVIE